MTNETSVSERKNEKSLRRRILVIVLAGLLLLLSAWLRYALIGGFPAPNIELSDAQQDLQLIGPDGVFILPFSQRMKKESILNSIAFFPDLEYHYEWQGKDLQIQLLNPPERGEQFQMSVSRQAQSWFGAPLERSYSFRYEIGRTPTVTGIFPEEQTLDQQGNIAVSFSHDMIAEERSQQDKFFLLEPEPDGEWVWHDSRTIVFHAQEGFSPSTKYRLSLQGELTTVNGSSVEGFSPTEFETEKLAVLPSTEDIPQEINKPYRVEFNYPVSNKALASHVELSDRSGNTIEISLELNDDSTALDIFPTQRSWYYDESYSIKIKNTLMPASGNIGLQEEHERAFLTESFFEVDQKFYSNAAPKILLSTKEELVDENIASAFTLSPDEKWSLQRQGKGITIDLIDSQKRENITVLFNPSSLSNSADIPLSNAQIDFQRLPDLAGRITTEGDIVCFSANQPLNPSLIIGYGSLESMQRRRITQSTMEDEPCYSENSFRYFLGKNELRPGYVDDINFILTSHLGEKLELSTTLDTKVLTRDDIVLQRQMPLFYNYITDPEELVFRFSSMNLEKVNATLCKLTVDKALEIETQYERRWYSFEPSQDDCLRFRRLEQFLKPQWGRSEDHFIRLEEFLEADEEIETGLYYFSVEAPNIYSVEGDLLQANLLIQYSDWKMLSKRGKNAFVWLLDTKSFEPVQSAAVRLHSNDGTSLNIRSTDALGRSTWEDNFLQYDFVTAKLGTEEVLLHAFSQEGLEPSQFGIPLNVSGNNYWHQFYLEDINRHDDYWEGMMILQERDGDVLRPANVTQAVVALYDQSERLLRRKFVKVNNYGMLEFGFHNTLSLKDGEYQLSVCIGLHQGICQGENIWTTVSKGKSTNTSAGMLSKTTEKRDSQMIDFGRTSLATVGQDVPVRLSGMQPGRPVLITIEREGVVYSDVLIPDATEETVILKVTQEMIPQAIISVFQVQEDKTYYEMAQLPVSREVYKLQTRGDSALSAKTFTLHQHFSLRDDVALEAFYPSLGTSVITAATLSQSRSQSEKPFSTALLGTALPTTIILPGELENSDDIQNAQTYTIVTDGKGKFANINTTLEDRAENVYMQTSVPTFLRPGEKVAMNIELQSNQENHANLQVNLSGENAQFPNGQQIFVGLSGMQTAQSTVPMIIPINASSEANISMLASASGNIISAQNFSIPIEKTRYPLQLSDVIVTQSVDRMGSIPFEKVVPQNWQAQITVATSPVAFILSEASRFFEAKAMNLSELSHQMGVYAQFKSLFDNDPTAVVAFDAELNIQSVLQYIAGYQNADGGWSRDLSAEFSDPIYTADIAKGISYALHSGNDIPESMLQRVKTFLKTDLDARSNKRVREKKSFSDLSITEVNNEMHVLNALSSLTPSGVSYANAWYNQKSILPTESKLLLLQTFEDYRDAGVDGTIFKIEEIIQDLRDETAEFAGMIWIDDKGIENQTDNLKLSAWYLEALVRQASSRSDIPNLIQWLISSKDELEYQSHESQVAYLYAMTAYLQIYSESIFSRNVSLSVGEKSATFAISPDERLQSFQWKIDLEEGDEVLSYASESTQPLFIEVVLLRKEQQLKPHQHGISVYHTLGTESSNTEQQLVTGEITLISEREREGVVIVHPQIMGEQAVLFENDLIESVYSYGYGEKQYFIPILPRGISKIRYSVRPENTGVFIAPGVFAYQKNAPEIYGLSQLQEIEVR